MQDLSDAVAHSGCKHKDCIPLILTWRKGEFGIIIYHGGFKTRSSLKKDWGVSYGKSGMLAAAACEHQNRQARVS